MIEKDREANQEIVNPLDTHAQLFYLFNPRFQSAIQLMSKKELIRLSETLVGSDFNKQEDVNNLAAIAKGINKKGLVRVVGSVIEHPLNDIPFKFMSTKEQKMFHLFDELLINKYFNCFKIATDKFEKDKEDIKQLEDVIIHNFNRAEFDKRKLLEKDSFAQAAKLLASKFLMIMVTSLNTAQAGDIDNFEKNQLEAKKEGEKNG